MQKMFIKAIFTAGCFLGAIYIFMPIALNYPQPTGKFAVGYRLLNGTPGFTVTVFYPSTQPKTQKFSYRPEYIAAIRRVNAQYLSQKIKVPEKLCHALLPSKYETYAKPNATILSELFPVVVYLPGIGGIGPDILYLQELASHGYVVCSIEPPADVAITILPDGKTVFLDESLKRAIAQNDRDFMYNYRNDAHKRWSTYISNVLDVMAKMNTDENSFWYHRLDLRSCAVFGSSHGGAVALDFCQNSTQCKAGIDMDGWTKTYNSSKTFTTPFLVLIGQNGGIIDLEAVRVLSENNHRPNFYEKIIPDAQHVAFGDEILLIAPWRYLFGQTTGDCDKIREEISKEIVTFFNAYLKR